MCVFYFQFLFPTILGTVLLFYLLPSVENRYALFQRSEDGSGDEIRDSAGDDIAQIAENMFDKLLNDSRSRVLGSLKNISNYLPLNVEYTVTVAKNCDIIKYNKPFYYRIPLIIAGVFIVLGIIFGFFGMLEGNCWRFSRYLENCWLAVYVCRL